MSGQELWTKTGMSSFIGRGTEAMGITYDFSLALPFIIKNGQGNKPEKQTVLHLVGSWKFSFIVIRIQEVSFTLERSIIANFENIL